MSNPYTLLSNQIETLLNRYLRARAALKIFETQRKLRSPTHSGRKKVLKNLSVLSEYRYFLGFSEEVFRFYMMLELAKFFDKRTDVLTIPHVIKFIRRRIGDFTSDNYFEHREALGDSASDNIKEYYRAPAKRDLADIDKSMRNIKPIVEKILIYRHEALAHDALDKAFQEISAAEVRKVFRSLEKILNKLASRVLWSTILRDAYLRDSENDTRRVVADLIEFHKLKQSKIPQLRG